MTLKEAIDIIGHYDVNFYYISGEHEGEEIPANKRMDAFDLAIRSLEAWEKVKEEIGDMSILSSYQLKSGEPTTTLYEGLCRHDEVLHIISKYLSEVEDKDV